MKNDYKLTWSWNSNFESEPNLQFTVIPNCESKEQAQEKAFKYMLDVWVENYDSLQEMIDDCFSLFTVEIDDGLAPILPV
tara:strand:- start:247 stop:486 length:240 start_codon:yes stop_codon:yes gene_type:complete